MTGMPAALALATDGRTSFGSCARTMRTLAPFEIIVSMSVACCSLLRFASASMYLPPAASTVCWMFGLSCAAQRGCWKLFHDTPTVHPAPPEPAAAAEPPALAAGLAPPPAGLAPPPAGLAPPPLLLQAAARTATTPSIPSRRFILVSPPPDPCLACWSWRRCPARLPPFSPEKIWLRTLDAPPWSGRPRGRIRVRSSRGRQRRPGPSRDEPASRVSEKRLEGQLRRSEQRSVLTEDGRDDAHKAARSGERSSIELALDGRTNERKDPPEDPAEHDETRIKDVDEAGQPDPEPAPAVVEGTHRCWHTGFGIPDERVDLWPAPPRWSPGHAQERPFADLGLPAADRAA